MVTCGCLFCENCYYQVSKIKNLLCPNCKKTIDFNKTINLKNSNQAKQISFIFIDPEIEIKKMMKALKYQKIQQKKYINFLENKIDILLKENNSLKETIKEKSINNNNIIYNNNNYNHQVKYNNIYQSYEKNMNDYYDGRNIIDLSKIKKIEHKSINHRTEKNIHIINDDYTSNINNLNVQTAREQYRNGNQTNILNVNINNSNKNGYSPYYKNIGTETPLNYNNNAYKISYNTNYDNSNSQF